MHIYIPSLGRAEKPNTIEHIPEPWLQNTQIVAHQSEKELYIEKGYKTVATKLEGIAAVRQWVMEQARKKGQKHVLFLDDDMTFSVRKGGKLKNAKKKDVGKMIALLQEWLESGFAHVGISPRFGNHHVDEDYAEVTRMNNAYAYDVEIFHKIGARFDALRVMEDFYVTLQFLKAGLPNKVTYKYAWGQRKSGEEGGCSLYRTGEVQKEAAYALNKAFPGVVCVVKKESKEAWGNIGKVRTDVRIQWKKAFKAKPSKDKGIGRFL